MSHSSGQPDFSKRYRVVQWATGNVGLRTLQRCIEHPNLDVVGVWVHNPAKAGRDAGDLLGLQPIGVTATNDIEEILALKADCVLYMPHNFDPDEICRILESGANIVTTRMELQNPAAFDAEICARIEAACQRGGSSIHATGSSPGFSTEVLPIAFTSMLRRLDHLSIMEFADCSSRDSPDMLFGMMGFGSPPGPTNQGQLDHAWLCFGPSFQLIATQLGLPIEEFKVEGSQGLAREDVHLPAGVVKAGTVAATRTRLMGMHKGKPLMSFTTIWYISTDIDSDDAAEWEFRDTSGWTVRVQGDCPFEALISFPVEREEDYAEMTPGLTAHRPINAVPYVCEAAAGIRTIVDLPQIIARLA